MRHDHPASIQRFIHQSGGCFFDQVQAPVEKKLSTAGDVLCPEGDFVDADDAHNVSLVKHRFQFETYFSIICPFTRKVNRNPSDGAGF
jgi:hypothetical protein